MKIIIKKLLYFAFAIPILMQAQSSVSGNVADTGANLPLPGVNISIEGTSRGTVTDFNGQFTVEPISKGQILKFEYLGFKTKLIPFNGQKTLDVKLEEDISQLNEVVLIGYGSAEKGDVTGAVATVSEKEFNQGAIVSPEQLLSAKTPGVRITTDGGAPGSGAKIRIRGGSSLNGSNDPLIVVDGVPLDQRGDRGGSRNPLNGINPNDIKDFVVLKDAASTAIYGSRASNGVILITTKKGRKESPLEVALDFKVTTSKINKTLNLLGADDFRNYVTENGRPDQLDLLGNANTDWQDEIFQTGVGTITNFELSKGFKSTTLRTSFNHAEQEGILKTDTFRKNTLSTVITQDLFDDNLKLRLNTKLSDINNRFADGGAIGNALSFDPTQAVRNDDGSFFEFVGQNNSPLNPLAQLEQDSNRAQNQRIITNLQAEYKIPYVTGLKFNLNLGVDYASYKGERFQAPGIGLTRSAPASAPAPFSSAFSGRNRNQVVDATFNYKRNIEAIKTRIDAVVGYSFQEFYEQKLNSQVTPTVLNVESTNDINRNALLSQFGRLNLEIADKYLISGSLRRDGSSRFAEENRFGIFPGVSLGWKLHNEKLFQNINAISQLKIRAGWGVTGQQEIDDSFAFLPVFEPSQQSASVQFGEEFVNTLRPSGSNRELKWEETINKNIGLDYGFFNGRLSGSLDFYSKKTEDLLAEVNFAAGSNTTDIFVANAAKISSEGVEFAINGDIFRGDNFNWNLAYNITYNKVEIDQLNESKSEGSSQLLQGDISGGEGNRIQLWKPGYNPSTYSVYRQVYDSAGRPIEGAYVDVNGDNVINNEDRIPYKKGTPDVFMGLTSTMNYKNADFSFTFRGNFGGYNYNNILSDRANVTSAVNGQGSFLRNVPAAVSDSNFNGQELFSDFYLQSSDFVRLDNISLGYTFEFEKLQLRLSATASNIWTITDYDGLDPEVITSDYDGIDNNAYPRPRTYVFGVNVKF